MTSSRVVTCTLTIKNDSEGEYEDDLTLRRADNNHIVRAALSSARYSRRVVSLLSQWVSSVRAVPP